MLAASDSPSVSWAIKFVQCKQEMGRYLATIEAGNWSNHFRIDKFQIHYSFCLIK